MVEAGEAAGVLDTVLDRVAIQIEKEQKIKRRVKGAMIYPSVVLVFATLVMAGMLMFLVPVFVKIFDSARRRAADADAVRDARVERACASYWFIIFPLVGGIGIFGFRRWKKTETGRQEWDTSSCASRCRSAASSARSRWPAGRARSRR